MTSSFLVLKVLRFLRSLSFEVLSSTEKRKPGTDSIVSAQKTLSSPSMHLPHLLWGLPFLPKANLWPGSKGVARKKHRPSYFGLQISDFGFF
jgi:hypothetical protein